jgi:hypothetical protein
MGSTKVNYRTLHENGTAIYFHVIDSNLMPLVNFDIAYRWYNERVLTNASELDMTELINDPKIKDTYEKFLDEEKRIFQLTQKKNGLGPANPYAEIDLCRRTF